ncbi:hypothetical protein ES705_36799 [subsurface metagenome]
MKKIILGLFIILFCFSIGIAGLQEEELSKEERAKIEKKIELLKKEKKQLHDIFNYLFEKFDSMDKEINQLEMKLQGKDLIQLMKEASKPEEKDVLDIIIEDSKKDVYELMAEESEKQREEEKKNKFAWLDKYRDLTKKDEQKKDLSYWDGYEAAAVDYFKSLGVWKTDPEKLEEENDRLEDLLRELRNEKSELEWDMMRYKSDLEWHMLELSSRLESDLLFNPLITFPFDYRYTYPGYSSQQTQRDWTNYDTTKFLFKLHRLSKGKMDWSKSWQLRLLLNNK